MRIKKRYFTDLSTGVKLSLLNQALGNIVSVVEAISTYPPDMFIDTIGVGFAYPFVKMLCSNVKLLSYTHYPFIQQDMVNSAPTNFKHHYYSLMLFLYQLVGGFADLIFANSSWTKNHCESLWRCPEKIKMLYPPCDTSAFSKIPLDEPKQDYVVSFSQFRKEKDQIKQLHAFKLAIEKADDLPYAEFLMMGKSFDNL